MVTTKTPAAYGEILQKKLLSHWLENTPGLNAGRDTLQLVRSMENLAAREPETAVFWFGNSFASGKRIFLCGYTVENYSQLLDALFHSPRAFYQSGGYEMLMDRTSGARLYGFLYALGCERIVDNYWKQAKNADEYQKLCLLLSMLDAIADKTKTDATILRRFFLTYGPVGIATYTKALVSHKGAAVYAPLDKEGQELLSRIAAFRASDPGSIEKIQQDLVPLTEMVARLQKLLVDNPFLIRTGAYEPRGILCRNLQGCFGFRIFGKDAPLGFQALLTGGKEGK